MTQRIDQLSIHLQEFKKELVLYVKVKKQRPPLITFQIENLEDKFGEDLVETDDWGQNSRKRSRRSKRIVRKC